METGKVRPSWRTIETIAANLGVPASTFVAREVAAPPARRDPGDLEQLCREHRYEELLALAESRARQEDAPSDRAVAHLFAGRALYLLTRPEEAVAHLRASRLQFKYAGDPWGAAEAMDWEGTTAALQERLDAALRLTEEALRRYRRLEPRRADVEARMVEHLGMVHLRRGAARQALARYQESLRVAGSVHELSRLGRIYHGLAHGHWLLDDRERAIDLMDKAVHLQAVEHDLSPVPARALLPRAENDLGMMLMHCGQLQRAEALFQSALRHFEEAGVERMRSHVLLSLSCLRQREGRLDEAFELARAAVALAAGLEETQAAAWGQQQLGRLHAERNEHDRADGCFGRALAMLRAAGLHQQAAECEAEHRALGRSGGQLVAQAGAD